MRGAGTLTVEILFSFDNIGLKARVGSPFLFRVGYGILLLNACA